MPSKSKPSFQTLPAELALKIFGYLNRCTSTSLGLTRKRFYALHKEFHGKVSIYTSILGLDGNECFSSGMLKE